MMKYLPRVWLFALGLLGSVLIVINSLATELQAFETTMLEIADQEFSVEIAKSYNQRQQGLMFRENLPVNEAMLFLYPFKGDHRIWMKNTLIPLTVVWLDHTATILDVKQLEPCTADPCASFGVDSPSNYVLELPRAFSGLRVGDQIPGILNIATQ